MINDPVTAENYSKNNHRLHQLILKKWSKVDAIKQDGVGLTAEEEVEYRDLMDWQNRSTAKLVEFHKAFSQLKKGDLVEATFDDGVIIAKIECEYSGGSYMITTLEGGGGCSIAAHKVRKLTALEEFNLGVNGPPE